MGVHALINMIVSGVSSACGKLRAWAYLDLGWEGGWQGRLSSLWLDAQGALRPTHQLQVQWQSRFRDRSIPSEQKWGWRPGGRAGPV